MTHTPKVIYGISRWTNASRSHARHIGGDDGLPLCRSKRRAEWTDACPTAVATCTVCIRRYAKATGGAK